MITSSLYSIFWRSYLLSSKLFYLLSSKLCYFYIPSTPSPILFAPEYKFLLWRNTVGFLEPPLLLSKLPVDGSPLHSCTQSHKAEKVGQSIHRWRSILQQLTEHFGQMTQWIAAKLQSSWRLQWKSRVQGWDWTELKTMKPSTSEKLSQGYLLGYL